MRKVDENAYEQIQDEIKKKKDALPRYEVEKGKKIVIDAQTTGLGDEEIPDEVIELSIIDTERGRLYSQRLRPLWSLSWPEAQEVNGISPEDVQDCPTILDEYEKIAEIIGTAEKIIGYNTYFDLDMLKNSVGICRTEGSEIIDCMRRFAYMYDTEAPAYGIIKSGWKTREFAARYVGNTWWDDDCRSLENCYADLSIYDFVEKWREKVGISPKERIEAIMDKMDPRRMRDVFAEIMYDLYMIGRDLDGGMLNVKNVTSLSKDILEWVDEEKE